MPRRSIWRVAQFDALRLGQFERDLIRGRAPPASPPLCGDDGVAASLSSTPKSSAALRRPGRPGERRQHSSATTRGGRHDPTKALPLVGIGASAGGVEAPKALSGTMAPSGGMGFVVVTTSSQASKATCP